MPWPLRMRETPNNEWPDNQQIGDVFKQVHELADGREETHWYVVLPNGAHFDIYGKWIINDELPNISAWPSISSHANGVHQGYHGYITNGELIDDLEGRTYS